MFWYNSIQFLFQIKHLGEDKKIFFAPLLALVDTSFQSERLSHEKGDTDEGKKCNSNKTEKAFSLMGFSINEKAVIRDFKHFHSSLKDF